MMLLPPQSIGDNGLEKKFEPIGPRFAREGDKESFFRCEMQTVIDLLRSPTPNAHRLHNNIPMNKPVSSLSIRSIAASLVLAAFAAASAVNAATITWSAPANITGDSDVSTAGTLVQASNVSGDATTVNGVTFTPFPMNGGSASSGIFTLTGPASDYGGYLAGNGSFTPAYAALLTTGNFGSNNSVMTLTISSLKVGTQYQFQVWINDSRGIYGQQPVHARAGNDVRLLGDVSGAQGGAGQYAIGTFTADATTQTIEFQGEASNGTVENAYMLREVTGNSGGGSGSAHVDVPGTADPFLAGMPDGSTAKGDTAPQESPIQVPLQFHANDVVTFAATGSTNYGGGAGTDPTDGFGFYYSGPENGISGCNYPLDALVGVFVEADAPAGKTPPPDLDFSPSGNVAGGVDYTEIHPQLRQIFFIGDGHNADGAVQRIVAPAGSSGAVRLFLASTDGSGWYNNSGAFHVVISGGTPFGPPPPAHGGLSSTIFTVNESDATSAGVADTVLRFAAQQNAVAANLIVRVQATTTPNVESSWTDLNDGNAGHMTLDLSTLPHAYVLNSTSYPPLNGIYFRAISYAPGYADSISNVVGPFDLASNKPRLQPTQFTIFSNTTPANIPAGAEIHFGAKQPSTASGVSVRVQSSSTPHDESSWTDLPNGTMQAGATEPFALDSKSYPTGSHVYFRAVATAPGYEDNLSNIIGPFDLVQATPPTVTLNPPSGETGSQSGDDLSKPILIKENASSGIATFNFGASANSSTGRQITRLELLVDGGVIDGANSSSASTQFNTSIAGMHELRAIAQDDLGSTADAAPKYLLVYPTGGQVYVFTGGNGDDWSDPGNWVSKTFTNGVPGPKDLAIVNGASVRLSRSVEVFAVVSNGATISGAFNLSVIGSFMIGGGGLRDVNVTIEEHGACVLVGDDDVAMNGTLTNRGRFQMTGLAGIRGFAGSANANGATSPNSVQPDGFGDFVRGFFNNIGKIIFPKRGGSKKTAKSANGTTVVRPAVELQAFKQVGGRVISRDGAGVISRDGAGLITQDGGSLITQDGGSIKAAKNGKAATAPSSFGFSQDGGETDLGASALNGLTIYGPVSLNGGVLTGSGTINGSLTNSGGFISPGHSPGSITVTGDFAQSTGGTLVIENGGPDAAEFDSLNVGGHASLGGSLQVRTINGYTPTAGDTFNAIGYGSASGNFESVSGNFSMTANSTGTLIGIDPSKPNPASAKLLNIATRMRVDTGDNAMIGGFIVTGTAPKKVIIRAIGPALGAAGITGTLQDPTLELVNPDGTSTFNNDWRDTQQDDILATGFQPSDNREAAILATLQPGQGYTAVVRGNNNSTGVGLVEVYDLDAAADSQLANISTRGLVQTGDNVMIGGFIVGGDTPAKVIIRAVGPSLEASGVNGVLQDPELEVVDANGASIINDGWRESQQADITATGVAPADNREAAIIGTFVPGAYTAVVRGTSDTTGVASVEAYNLQ